MPLYGSGSISQGTSQSTSSSAQSSAAQSSVAQSCGANTGKLFASNVSGQGMSSATSAVASYCGSCGITVVSKSSGYDISCK